MNRKTIAITAAILGLTSASFVAVAASPAKTIETREANFKVMGKAMKGMFDQFKTPAPDMAVIKASAAALSQAAPKVAGHFPKGSGPESGVKTHALPAIWEKPADFKAAVAKLGQEGSKVDHPFKGKFDLAKTLGDLRKKFEASAA